MEKLQKRLEQLELISNNTKLLSELLAHYGAASGEQEKLLMKVGPTPRAVHSQCGSCYIVIVASCLPCVESTLSLDVMCIYIFASIEKLICVTATIGRHFSA